MTVIGGNATPVYIVEDSDLVENGGDFKVIGRTAIRVYGDDVREIFGDTLQPIYILSDSDLVENGGRFKVIGGSANAIPLNKLLTTRKVKGRVAIPVYLENPGWIDPYPTLLCDEFVTARVAGAIDGTLAEPSGATRNVSDSGLVLDISGGKIRNLTGGSVGITDPSLFYNPPITREVGIAAYFQYTPSGIDRTVFGIQTPPSTLEYAYERDDQGNVFVSGTGGRRQVARVSQFTNNIERKQAIVLRGTGAYFFGKAASGTYSPDWHLIWVSDFGNDPTKQIYGMSIASGGAGSIAECSAIRVRNLGGVFSTDLGYASSVLPGSRNVGDTYTHPANALIKFTVDTLPSVGQIEVSFKEQDVNNHWRVTVDSTGRVDLDQVTGGTPTLRGTGVGIANGWQFVLITDGSNMRGFRTVGTSNGSRLWNVTSGAYNGNTDGRVISLGTGGAISDLETFPRDPTGEALTLLEALEIAC